MEQSRNILLVSHFSNLSGAPVSLALLAKQLRHNGYNVSFSIPRKGPLEDVLAGLDVPYQVTGTITSIWNLYWLIKKNKIDIVHANTIIAAPAAVLAWAMGCRLVWHIREDLSGGYRLTKKIIERIADRIIVLSASMVPYFHPSVKDKLSVVYNGVDLSIYKLLSDKEKKPLLQELALSITAKKVAVIGTIEPRKGQRCFIDAVKILKVMDGVEYLIIGDALPGWGRYKQKLEDECRREGLPVRFIAARADIPRILQLVDIVCIPSLAEPFGRMAIEGMAVKKPVIVSDVGGLPEIVTDKTGIVVPPGRPSDLAGAIKRLLDDEALCSTMGLLGYERVREFFTIENHVKHVAEIYDELL